ncbi:50S ribosomal protein L18 [Pontibacter sp. G13]|uniref:50S ribosomal protein L18 n=1 Tax=Pontibacter sp. G13 TaxID=3074898 RepID=UPI00288963BC|nr:50S ribosomal protein L18 [Pontibacter sp. G13]WNJ16533.1 50S ribosomal protein L18 [Pontibacter sp. G13]
MGNTAKKVLRRERIHRRLRSKISGTADIPRLCVFRSNKQIYAQIIDDEAGQTLASCSSRLKDLNLGPVAKTEAASAVGKKLAEIAKSKGIEKVVFDRGGYKFHGRVKALAEGAREGGLNF